MYFVVSLFKITMCVWCVCVYAYVCVEFLKLLQMPYTLYCLSIYEACCLAHLSCFVCKGHRALFKSNKALLECQTFTVPSKTVNSD